MKNNNNMSARYTDANNSNYRSSSSSNNNNHNSSSQKHHSSSQHGSRNHHSSESRSQQPRQQQQQQPQSQRYHQSQSNSQSNISSYHDQRERSGQRNQHPDSSMNRFDPMSQANIANLGSVRFTPGLQTKELPQIETKLDPSKKFCGRCRLFVGNLPHNTTEEKVKVLFERFGEVGEVYLGPKSAFAFVKMDTRANAEAARDALDCTLFDGRALRVRLAAHAAAIRVKNLSQQVTNELLAYAFRFFGEIERAVIVVDDKGKSIGEGIVEFSRKQSALYAVKKCQADCFMLTAAPNPVLVEPYDQHDEDEGLPEKSVNKNSNEYNEQREIGPRFAEPGTFEHTFAMKWKQQYEIEKQRREALESEIQDARRNLQNQVDSSKKEHRIQQLKHELEQLEDRHRQELMLRQRELGGLNQPHLQPQNQQQQQHLQHQQQHHQHQQQHQQQHQSQQQQQQNHHQQQQNQQQQQQQQHQHQHQHQQQQQQQQPENPIQMQVNRLHEFMASQAQSATSPTQSNKMGQVSSSGNQELDPIMPIGSQIMGPAPVQNVPTTYADAASMGMSQPQFIPVQTSMNIPPPPSSDAHNLFTAYIPPPPALQVNDDNPGNDFSGYGGGGDVDNGRGRGGNHNKRQYSKQPRPYSGTGNNINLSTHNGRPRKRGKF